MMLLFSFFRSGLLQFAGTLTLALVVLLGISTITMAAPPDLTSGGVPNESPAKTINLGPTGLRGWIYHVKADTSESRQILLTEVDAGSPAAPWLAVGDVILGADGTGAIPVNFTADARRSFAGAIADAEASTPATLKVIRWRAGATATVDLTLAHMGAYSATAPYNCTKSSKILQEGADYFFNNETSGRYAFGAMALLAVDDAADPNHAAYRARLQSEAHALIPDLATRTQMMSDEQDTTGMITWQRGHTLIFLAEYYLVTGDNAVLPAIEAYAVNIAKNQSLFGTVGHKYAEKNLDGSNNGPMGGVYGVVNSAGMPCFLGLLLAKECGLTDPELDPAIAASSRFFAYYAGRGSIPYGEHEPGTGGHENNGKSGLAAVAFALQNNRVEEGKFFAKMATASSVERENGHTGAFFNYLWAPLGAAVGGEEAAAAHFSRISWYLDLHRRWDGGFDYDCLNGEGPNSGSQYNDFRMSTAALLTYALPLRKLSLTGRGHDPARDLTSTDVTEALVADDYDADPRSDSELISDLGSWSPKVQRKAAEKLATRSISAGELNQITSLANDTNGDSRVGACLALGKISDSGTANARAATLANLLTDPQNHVRFMAAEAMRYLPTSAKMSQLNAILAAADSTAGPLMPFSEEDPLHFAHSKLAVLLFYSGNAYGPRGVIYNNLNGVDRGLLYPAVRAVAANPIGFARSTLNVTYKSSMTQADVEAVADAIVESVGVRAPADKMFSSGVREGGLDALKKFGYAEGVPLSMIYMVNDERGSAYTKGLGVLQSYAGECTTVNPDPQVIEFCEALLAGSHAAAAQAVLDAISADPNPTPLTPLKSIQLVAPDSSSLTLPTNSTILRTTAIDLAQGDSFFTWRKIHGAGDVSFTPNGTGSAADTAITIDPEPGQYLFEVTMSDSRGLTEVVDTVALTVYNSGGTLPSNEPPVADPQSLTVPQAPATAITLTGTDPEGYALTYTVTSQPTHGTLTGTAPDLVYAPMTPYEGSDSFTFEVMDSEGQTASATVSINVALFWGQITVDGTAFVSANASAVSLTFDASGSDKLVVVVTGEHGFNNAQGNCSGITYDGVPLVRAVDRNPLAAETDTTYNDIWYLDNPATSTGLVQAAVTTRGNMTVFGLSGTAPGVGATVIGAPYSRSADLTTTANNSLVIASFGMGGAGNTADPANVDADSPLTEVSATKNGSNWDSHVTGYAHVPTAGPGTYSFTGGNSNGAHVIAAEFLIETTPPTLASAAIVDNKGGGSVMEGETVTYTLTFSEPMDSSTISPADFQNSPSGTATVTIDSVSVTADPTVFEVVVTPIREGTLRLEVKAGATVLDPSGNPLDTGTAIADDSILTVTGDYGDWTTLYPGGDLGDRNGDFDGDLLSNDEERAWGLDPTSAASNNPISLPLDASGSFTYTRRDPALTGMTYTVWVSTDMESWDIDVTALQDAGPADVNGVQSVGVTLTPGLMSESVLFLRIGVTE